MTKIVFTFFLLISTTLTAQEEEQTDRIFSLEVEEVPIFPGCNKGDNEERKNCMTKEVDAFVRRNFNPLIEDLGLNKGETYRIHVYYTIDEQGFVKNIRARGPNTKLEEEAIRVVSLLPQMIPAKQKGIPVEVKYSLPIYYTEM